MGCSHTNSEQRFQRAKMISILDKSFLKGKTSEKQFLSIEHINYKLYQHIDPFVFDMNLRYINSVLISEDQVEEVIRAVASIDLRPYIYVLSKNQVNNSYQNLKVISDLQDLSEYLEEDLKVIQNIEQQESKEFLLADFNVAILRRPSKGASFSIVEKMLQEKEITFRTFSQYNQMFKDLEEKSPFFIISQDLYTLQISKVLQKKKTKIFSYAPTNDKTFFQMAYYYSNDLTDIVNQIQNQIIEKDMVSTPCTRAFIYSAGLDHVLRLEEILLKNQFEVRTVEDMNDLIGSVISLFAITLFVEESEVKNVQKKLMQINFLYKTKIIVVRNIQFDDTNINKEIKEVKKGYKLTKQVCREVDIVDKNCDSAAFAPIRQQLQKNNVIVNLYKSARQYINRGKYHSEMLISSFNDRIKLNQYITSEHLRIKIIIYCAKSKINQDLIGDNRFVMVDWNFSRIVKFLKISKIYYPRIANFTNRAKRMEEVVQKIKNTNRRVSLQKWSTGTGVVSDFVVVDSKRSKSEIVEIQKQAAELWKLEYDPIKNLSRLKSQFIDSLKELRKIYKVKIEDIFFDQLAARISQMSIWDLVKEINTMFESSNTITMFINNSLCKLEQIFPLQVMHLKQFMVLMSLNSLSYFQVLPLRRLKLVCWVSKFEDQYAFGSIYLNKKFQIFYEQSSLGIEEGGKFKIQIQIVSDKYQDKLFEYNNFVQYKDKYICMPYTRFRFEDKKTVNGDKSYTVIKFSYLKDNQYLHKVVNNNLNSAEGIYKVFSNQSLIATIKNPQKLDYKMAEIQQITSLLYFHKSNYSDAITHTLSAIKIHQEDEQVMNPTIIAELLYQAALIYYHLQKMQECKKYLMACLRMQPTQVLKQKTTWLKSKLKGKMRASKLGNLQNSLLLQPLKSGQQKNKQLDLFSDFQPGNGENEQQNMMQSSMKKSRRTERTS